MYAKYNIQMIIAILFYLNINICKKSAQIELNSLQLFYKLSFIIICVFDKK